MPVLHLNLIRGYDDDTLARLTTRLTEAVRASIDADPDSVTVFVHEVAPAGYRRGARAVAAPGGHQETAETLPGSAGTGPETPRRPGASLPDAEAVVRGYLAEMEARDLEAASRRLAPGFTMEFPGPVTFTRPAELVDWAASRYRRVGKAIERCESVYCGGDTIVWCTGTLWGEWPDGSAFEGIRFVDRFTVRAGLIIDQRVWNDLAEVRSATR